MATPGAVLAGRYRLEARLGAGGMGEVWRATDQALGRPVAVKLMHSSLLDDPGFARRFRAEAQAMGSIHHPGVITIHDFHPGDGEGPAFLVMELVEGESLAEVLRQSGRLPAAKAMSLVAQAAAGLQAAHDRGIIHRDVKPGNLLVRPDGRVVLTDFGIARSQAATVLTATGVVVGTLPYLAPEQVLGQPATAASDIYALGLVGYECLAGRRPFPRDNPFASAMARVREAPAPLPTDLPPLVRTVIERALARDPAHRWPTAAAFATACRRAAKATRAPPPGPAPGPPPHTRPSRSAPPRAAPAPPRAAPAAPGRVRAARTRVRRSKVARAGPRRLLAGVGVAIAMMCVPGLFSVVLGLIDSQRTGPDRGSAVVCRWLPHESEDAPLVGGGTPPLFPVPAGPAVLTLTTNHGVIEVTVDAPAAPCTYRSLRYLALVHFYDDTACHRLVDEGIYVLHCGDPSGTGAGGPAYQFAEENLPVGQSPTYPAGTVAMARTGGPATTGSQFFIMYEDTDLPPDHTVVGRVTLGMEIVLQVAAAGHDDAYVESGAGGGVPNREIVIEAFGFYGS